MHTLYSTVRLLYILYSCFLTLDCPPLPVHYTEHTNALLPYFRKKKLLYAPELKHSIKGTIWSDKIGKKHNKKYNICLAPILNSVLFIVSYD